MFCQKICLLTSVVQPKRSKNQHWIQNDYIYKVPWSPKAKHKYSNSCAKRCLSGKRASTMLKTALSNVPNELEYLKISSNGRLDAKIKFQNVHNCKSESPLLITLKQCSKLTEKSSNWWWDIRKMISKGFMIT